MFGKFNSLLTSQRWESNNPYYNILNFVKLIRPFIENTSPLEVVKLMIWHSLTIFEKTYLLSWDFRCQLYAQHVYNLLFLF